MSSPTSSNEWVKVSKEGSSSSPPPSATLPLSTTDSPVGSRASSPPSRMPSTSLPAIRAPVSSTQSSPSGSSPSVPSTIRTSSPLSRDPSRTHRASSSPVGHSTQSRLASPAPSLEPAYSINDTTTQRGRHGFLRRRNRFHPLSPPRPRSPSTMPYAFRASSPPAGHWLSSPAPSFAPTSPEDEINTQACHHNCRHSRRQSFCPPESLYAMRLDEDRLRGSSRAIFDWDGELSSIRGRAEQSSSSFTIRGGTPYSNSANWMGSARRIGPPYMLTAPRTLIDGTLPSPVMQSNEDAGRTDRGEMFDPFPINRLLGTRSIEFLQRVEEPFTTLEYIGAWREAIPELSTDDIISGLNEEIVGLKVIILDGGRFKYDRGIMEFLASLDLEDGMENEENDDSDSVDSRVYGPHGDVNSVLPNDHYFAFPNGRLLIVPRNGRQPFQLRGFGVEYRLELDGHVTIFPTDGRPPISSTVNSSHSQSPGYFHSVTLFQ